MSELGKALVGIGFLLVLLGALLLLAANIGFPLGLAARRYLLPREEFLALRAPGYVASGESAALGDLVPDRAIPTVTCCVLRNLKPQETSKMERERGAVPDARSPTWDLIFLTVRCAHRAATFEID